MSKRKAPPPPRRQRVAPQPEGLHFGQKVYAWLGANAAARPRPIEPSSVRQLAVHVGIDVARSHVLGRMLKRGNLKLDVALRIARVMRVSLDSLADPSRPFPETLPDAIVEWVRSMEPSVASAILDAWSPEVEALVVSFASKRGRPEARGA